MKSSQSYNRKGFTLTETLLAVALVGVLISIFLTVFVPARGMVQKALTRQEAERIAGVLRAEMATLRPDEHAKGGKSSPNAYMTPFDKGFYWLKRSARPSSSIIIFSYRADLSKGVREDGTYPPIPASKSIPGKNTEMVTIACPMDDRLHRKDIKDAVGPVFIVKMSQLIPNGKGGFSVSKSPGSIQGGSTPETYYSSAKAKIAYGGAIFYRADFYLMYPPNPERYRTKSWKKLGRPLFSSNLSFRR